MRIVEIIDVPEGIRIESECALYVINWNIDEPTQIDIDQSYLATKVIVNNTLIVDGCLIVENKAVRELAVAHEVQLVNYLTATGIDDGLLLNFGAKSLAFRRKFRLPEEKRECEFCPGYSPLDPFTSATTLP